MKNDDKNDLVSDDVRVVCYEHLSIKKVWTIFKNSYIFYIYKNSLFFIIFYIFFILKFMFKKMIFNGKLHRTNVNKHVLKVNNYRTDGRKLKTTQWKASFFVSSIYFQLKRRQQNSALGGARTTANVAFIDACCSNMSQASDLPKTRAWIGSKRGRKRGERERNVWLT